MAAQRRNRESWPVGCHWIGSIQYKLNRGGAMSLTELAEAIFWGDQDVLEALDQAGLVVKK